MSYTIIKRIDPFAKVSEDVVDLPNSWLSAPLVWSHICERYLKKERTYWLFVGGSTGPAASVLWGAWMNMEIPEHVRAVFLFTLDRLYVEHTNYPRFVADIEKLCDEIGGDCGHWRAIAMATKAILPAIGIRCNAIAEDSWGLPGDWSEVYAEIDGLLEGEKAT